MSHLLPCALSLTGFTALAFAMYRQQHDLFQRSLPRSTTIILRLVGGSALLLALDVLVDQRGWGLGLVVFSGHTSLAAGIVHGALVVYMRVREHSSRCMHR